MRHRRFGEAGAALVEGAFAIPIFFFLLLGLVDFGLLALESNKASNAARDGARVGVIHYRGLDDTGSADYALLKAAIEKNLPGRVIPDTDLDVGCLTPGGASIACASATVDVDRVSVRVEWPRDAISPVADALGFGSVDVSGTARMTIIGTPQSGPAVPPAPCEITGVTVSPNPVARVPSGPNAGQLAEDLTITVTGSGSCSDESLILTQGNGANREETTVCASGCLGTHTYVGSTDAFWEEGDASAEVITSAGSVEAEKTFDVEDEVVPVPCAVTGMSVSPSPVTRFDSGPQEGGLQSNLQVTVSGSGDCFDLTVTIADVDGESAIVCTGPCLGNLSYLGGAHDFWSAGQATGTVVEGGGTVLASTTFQVVDPEACSVDIQVTPDPATSTNQDRLRNAIGNVKLRVVITLTGTCPSLTGSMTASNGTTTFGVCSGVCAVTYDYSGNDAAWPVGTGRVQVVGVGVNATKTFQVTR